MAYVDTLLSTRNLYADLLEADATAGAQPDYSLDGESVSRQAWREGLLRMIKDLNELINAAQPYELRSVGV